MAGMEFTFTADVGPFVAAMGEAIAAAKEFESAVNGARDAEMELGASGAEAAAGLSAQAAAMDAAAASVRDLDRNGISRLNQRISEGAKLARSLGDGLKSTREDIDRSGEAMREMERSTRLMGLGADEAGNAASRAMQDYSQSLSDAKSVLADAERGINGLQSSTRKSQIQWISAAHGLKDAERGVNDLESAASDAAASGSGFSKLTGMLGPAGLIGLIGGGAGVIAGAVPAVLSLGGGFASFGAMAYPALAKVKQGLSDVTYAQQQYQLAKGIEKRDPTKSNLENQQKALASLKTTWGQMPKPVRGAVSEIQQFEKAWSKASRKSGIQKDALGDIKLAVGDAKKLIPTVTTLAHAFQPIAHGFLKDLGKEVNSKGFKSFIHTLKSDMGPAAHALKGIGNAVGGFITDLTKREAKPGTQMLQSIGKFLKTITPGTVSGLVGLTHGITGFFNVLSKVASSGAVSNLVGDVKSLFTGIHQVAHDFDSGASVGQLFHDITHFGDKPQVAKLKISTQISAEKVHEQNLMDTLGFKQGPLGGKRGAPVVTVPIKPKIESGSLGKALDASQQLKAHAAAATVPVKVKADGTDIKKQISDAAKTGGNIPVKGRVTLTGLAAGIKSQITALHIPDTKVHIAMTLTGAGAAKAQMAQVVAAARHTASAASAALNSLGAAGAAAGRALDQGLAGGILGGESSVVAAAASVAGAAAAAARKAAGISSPSKVWKGIGKNMIQGLLDGLQGGKAQIEAAARAITGAAAPFKDQAITATVKKLREDVRKAFRAGDITAHQRDGLVDYIDAGNRKLMKLAQQRAKIMGEIRAATALAKSVRQSAIASADITTMASNVLADQNKGEPGMTIQQGQQQQLAKIRQFTHAIRQLKREGLDKTSIKQLLAAGVSGGLPAAQRLLSEGPKAVKQSAKLQQEIIKASKQLGITGANAAYESASQIGKGLAQGLRDQLKPIVAAMKQIARALISTLAHELGLKPGQSLGDLFGGLGGGGGHGGGGHHGKHHHGAGGGMHMDPGGPHGLIHGGPPPMVMHPGMRAAPIHVHVHNHIVVQVGGQQAGAAIQQIQLRHARRNIATGIKLPLRAA